MPLSPFALLGLDEAKSYLKVEHDLEDDLIEGLINQVTSRLEKRYDRVFVARDLSDWVQGDGDSFLFLRYPIISVGTVTPDNEGPLAADEFTINSVVGFLGGRRWHGGYLVEYRAGYEPIDVPEWIRSEAFDLLSSLYEGRGGDL